MQVACGVILNNTDVLHGLAQAAGRYICINNQYCLSKQIHVGRTQRHLFHTWAKFPRCFLVRRNEPCMKQVPVVGLKQPVSENNPSMPGICVIFMQASEHGDWTYHFYHIYCATVTCKLAICISFSYFCLIHVSKEIYNNMKFISWWLYWLQILLCIVNTLFLGDGLKLSQVQLGDAN